jgi:hypothetical protein
LQPNASPANNLAASACARLIKGAYLPLEGNPFQPLLLMANLYPFFGWALCASALLAPTAAQAQAPVISSVVPMANARTAARNGAVTVNFSQPLTAASAGALKVFSAQRGGLRSRGATPAVVSGNALSWAPSAYDFRPGETVQYTVTTAAAGTGGALTRPRVGQFTTAAGGAGRGAFGGGDDVPVGYIPTCVAIGDVDGDGALDFLSGNIGAPTVSVRLNGGGGLFFSIRK